MDKDRARLRLASDPKPPGATLEEIMQGITYPMRNDGVAPWLKRCRDAHPVRSAEWHAIDRLLDEWREKADYGLALHEDGGDP